MQNLDVIPIVIPQLNWDYFLLKCRNMLGKNVSDSIDSGLVKKDVLGFLVSLAEAKDCKAPVITITNNPGHILQHTSYSFLAEVTHEVMLQIAEINQIYYLIIPTGKHVQLCLMSGTLEQWYGAVLNSCSDLVSQEIRLLFDKILIFFEQMGLGAIWLRHKKVTLPDKTFKLLPK